MRRGFTVLRRHAASSPVVSDAVFTNRWFRVAAAAAGSVETQQSQGCSEANHHQWMWLGAVSAAAAGLALQPGIAYCEADEQGGWNAMSRVVSKIWQNLDEDLHRDDALLSSPFADFARPEAPTLRLSSGNFSLRIPIRAGVEVSSVMAEIAKQFGANAPQDSSKPSFKVEDRRHDKVYTFDPSVQAETPEKGEVRPPTVQVHIPRNSLFALPHVELYKQGVFTSQELDRFAAILKVANSLPQDNIQVRRSFTFSSEPEDGRQPDFDPSNFFQRLHNAAMGSLFDELEGSFSALEANMRKYIRPTGEDDRLDAEGRIHPNPARRHSADQANAEAHSDQHQQEVFEYGSKAADQAAKKLQDLGALVYPPGNQTTIDWGILAGYADQKQVIEDTMLLALLHPEVYDKIAQGTRHTYASNKPRAVLFEGPPGTGKTTSARVIASQASVPLVYVPLEAIGSKWYGESERKLSDMFKAAEALPGCIIFLDEVDSLATSRGNEMHEATRRLLGVLLRHLDGFETNKRSVVIAATNRKQDLDPALRSRFNTSVEFGLPDEACRAEIIKIYAKHLSQEDMAAIAAATPGLAGRDLKDLSEQAERRWASKIIRKIETEELPPVAEYMAAANQRMKEVEAAETPKRLPFLF